MQTAEQIALPKLGIIAGGTDLPRMVAELCQKEGREFYLLALEESCLDSTVESLPHDWVRLGAIGKAISLLKQAGVKQIVMAGKVNRPRLSQIRPDLKGTMLLAKLGSHLLRGDDELLRIIVRFLEDEGFEIIGVDEVTPELVTPNGPIGQILPDKRAQADIEYGVRIARGIGALDIGQSVVIQQHQVLGVEAIEGTDALIERCIPLKIEEKGGVLVKVKKPNQERRVDLPTIGVATVEKAAAAGLAGIAIEAGSSLMLNRRELARRADALGIFVIGFTLNENDSN